MNIKISKLPSPVFSGDWHDQPLKWQVFVEGQAEFRQHFATRKNARQYSGLVRTLGHLGFNEVCRAYVDL